ncbi:MAG: hypothetical protein ACP5ER_04765, partial [Candidatus Bathyarchaeales archaeon]
MSYNAGSFGGANKEFLEKLQKQFPSTFTVKSGDKDVTITSRFELDEEVGGVAAEFAIEGRNPAHFWFAQGPHTGIVARERQQDSIIIKAIGKASEQMGLLLNKVNIDEDEYGQYVFQERTPLESLYDAITTAATTDKFHSKSFAANIWNTWTEGDPNAGHTKGGMQWVSPYDTEGAVGSAAMSVAVSMSPRVRNTSRALERLQKYISGEAESSNPEYYRSMAGRALTHVTQQTATLTPVAQIINQKTNSMIAGETPSHKPMVRLFGKESKAIKHHSLSEGRKFNVLKYPVGKVSEDQKSVYKESPGIIETGEEEGYLRPTMKIPGAGDRGVYVYQDVVRTKSHLEPGTATMFKKDPFSEKGQVATLLDAWQKEQYGVSSSEALKSTKFRWGVFKKLKEEDAKEKQLYDELAKELGFEVDDYGPYEKVRDLKGFALKAGEKAIIGFKIGEDAEGQIVYEPITAVAPKQRMQIFKGEEDINIAIPRTYDPDSGKTSVMSGTTYIDNEAYTFIPWKEEQKKKFQSEEFSGGANVIFSGEDMVSLVIGLSQESATGVKGPGGEKIQITHPGQYGEERQRTVKVGGKEVAVGGVAEPPKKKLPSFLAAMSTMGSKKLTSFFEEYMPEKTGVIGYFRRLRQAEEEHKAEYRKGEMTYEEYQETYPQGDWEGELLDLYNKETGSQGTMWDMMQDLYNATYSIAKENPDFYEKYKLLGYVEQQMIPSHDIPQGLKHFMRARQAEAAKGT